eukprot:7096554-Prymnesium_polylepis.1
MASRSLHTTSGESRAVAVDRLNPSCAAKVKASRRHRRRAGSTGAHWAPRRATTAVQPPACGEQRVNG